MKKYAWKLMDLGEPPSVVLFDHIGTMVYSERQIRRAVDQIVANKSEYADESEYLLEYAKMKKGLDLLTSFLKATSQ